MENVWNSPHHQAADILANDDLCFFNPKSNESQKSAESARKSMKTQAECRFYAVFQ